MAKSVTSKIVLQAEDRTARAFRSATAGADGLQKRFSGLALQTAGVAAVGAAAAGAFLVMTKRAIETTRSLQAQADMAGVNVEAFQELEFAAGRYMVSQEALTDGMKELALRADEFVTTGAGSAAEAFKRLGFTQAEVNERLADTPGLLTEITRRMEGMGEAAKIRIADEIFGGQGGERFVAMISDGADSLESMRRRARDLGLVMNADLVAGAQGAARELETLENVLSVKMTATLVSLAPLIDDIASGLLDLAETTKLAYANTFKEVEEFDATEINNQIEIAQRKIDRLIDTLRNYQAVAKEKGGELNWFQQWGADTANRDLQEQMQILAGWQKRLEMVNAAADDLGGSIRGTAGAARELTAEEKKRGTTIQAIMDGLDSEIAVLNTQAITMGESEAAIARYNREQQIANQLRMAGITLTDAESASLQTYLEHLEHSTEFLLEQQDIRRNSYAQLQADVAAYLDGMIRQEAWAAEMNRQVWESGMQGKLQITGSILGQLAGAMEGNSKKMFKVAQAAAVGETIIETYRAAQGAYAAMASIPFVGPALGAAAAAAAIAAGMARVQAIKSQRFGGSGGGSPGASGGGVSSAPAGGHATVPDLAPAANDRGPAKVFNVTIDSSLPMIPTESAIELMRQMADLAGDGFELSVNRTAV